MIAAAILTGGQARRLLGRDKSRLVTGADGRTILDRQLALVGPLVSEILIVTSPERADSFTTLPPHAGSAPIRVVIDHYPGTGPLGAVLTALEAGGGAGLLVIAGDMPALTEPFLRSLIAEHEKTGNEITAPASERGLEPLAAIYAPASHAALVAAFDAGERALHRAMRSARLGVVPAAASIFQNINTPEDLA